MIIEIRRSRLTPARPGGFPLGWVYEYTTPVDITWNRPDGTSAPGPRAGQWTPCPGSGIADARRALRRMFPEAKIIETWKARS